MKIKIWEPINNLTGDYWFENLSITNENFVFIYRKNKQHNTKLHIICAGGLPSFRYTNETFSGNFIYLDSLEEIKTRRPWCFYTVEDSDYLKKISADSGGLSDHFDLKHYCIISGDEMVELIYSVHSEPVVEVVVDGVVIESSDPSHRNLK